MSLFLALAVKYISPAPAVSRFPAPAVEYFSPAPPVFPSPVPVVEYFSPEPAVPAESAVPYVEQDTDEEFLEKLDNRWQSRGKGTFRLLRYSEGAKFFQFWQNERLLADDVIQRTGEPGQCGRTWHWHDPEYADGPSECRHAVRFGSPEQARRFQEGVGLLMTSPDDSHDFGHFYVRLHQNVFGFLCLWFGFVAPLRWFEEDLGPRMLVILAGVYQEDSYAARRPRPSSFPAWHVQGWYCWFFLSRCIPSSCRQAIAALVVDMAVACACLVLLGDDTFRAVFTSVVDMLKMLGILVGMDQKDSSSLVVLFGNGTCRAGLLVALHSALCSPVCRPSSSTTGWFCW